MSVVLSSALAELVPWMFFNLLRVEWVRDKGMKYIIQGNITFDGIYNMSKALVRLVIININSQEIEIYPRYKLGWYQG